MQGKLSEIDIRSILQLLELGQRTGELFVEAYSTPLNNWSASRANATSAEASWFVFLVNGQIIYAGDSSNNLSRLRDYLRRYKIDSALDRVSVSSIGTVNTPEYGHLWALIETHALTPAQGKSIIQGMVNETLFDLLSLHQGAFIFEISPALSPQLTTLEIAPLVTQIMKQVQEWKQLHPYIQSPDQRPVIANPTELRERLPEHAYITLGRWIDGQTSIRQMARLVNRDIVAIAKAIHPYIQQGLVQLQPDTPQMPVAQRHHLSLYSADKMPRVVCIDDGKTVRKTVEYILGKHGYEASSIGNPVKALSLVFQLKPDLILCDIAMPELDGYEVCAMLRKSSTFRQTPIVMLTGKDGFIDRIKARMVGATDYLTKPFGETELLTLVEKYAGPGRLDLPAPDELLAEAIEDELENDITESASAP